MAEWGYLLEHVAGQYLPSSVFREEVIKAETMEVAHKGKKARISLLVDVVLAALAYSGDDPELDRALTAAGYLPAGEDEDD